MILYTHIHDSLLFTEIVMMMMMMMMKVIMNHNVIYIYYSLLFTEVVMIMMMMMNHDDIIYTYLLIIFIH